MGALWNVDVQREILRCVAVWHMPAARIPQFEATTRDYTFPKGVGLPGRIWGIGEPVWIENIVQEENFPRAPVAAKEGLHAAFGFPVKIDHRSEEHTSELQSLTNLVCRLLLEKKKDTTEIRRISHDRASAA